MSSDELRLVDPHVDLREAYLDMADEFLAAGEECWVRRHAEAVADFAAFVRMFDDHARGVNLLEGRVAYNDFWLMRGDRMIGRLNFRHRLTEHLLHEGGHIGYAIRPSERRRGYGTRMLALALPRVRAFGLTRVLITCDTKNVASAKVIEHSGGILENVCLARETGKPKARYWIDLGSPAAMEGSQAMSGEELRLVDPAVEFERGYTDLVLEFRAAGEPFHQGHYDDLADFPAFVEKLKDQARGVGLPPCYGPCNHYWLVRGGEVVGTSRLRHGLTPKSEHEGGHIGYDVRPSERGKGYATTLLALTLDKARRRGLARVLLTCDDDNAASVRVIEKSGGQLEDRRISQRTGKIIRRYWIDLGTPAATQGS